MRTLPEVMWYNCDHTGHYSGQCNLPDRRQNGKGRRGIGMIQVGHLFAQDERKNDLSEVIDKDWILLDSCSTDSVCCNVDLLKGLRNCTLNEMLHIITNSGFLKYKIMGSLKMFPMAVHYNEDSIANTISLHQGSFLRGVRITMDTNVEKYMIVAHD